MAVIKSNQQSGDRVQRQGNQSQVFDQSRATLLPSLAPSLVTAAGNPQEGNLATPINSSKLTRWFINQLPAYRQGVSSFQRGLQVGLSHGFWLVGPFVTLGPLRDTGLSVLAGLIATIGVVMIATLAIAAYAASSPLPPITTLTTPNPPPDLSTAQGWQAFARGFLVGGTAGATFAAALLLIFSL